MTTYIFKIISLLGGLSLFLFGMDIMGKALERQAGGKLQTILSKMSGKVWKGFLLGAAVTAVIQSSSATTVMVVGFVNSGIMTLKQAVGVIMGSNVGTTVTAWILSLSGLEGDSFLIKFFKPSTLAPLIGIFGILLYMGKSEKKKGIGTIMLGFMALMTGMDLMSSSMSFLKSEAWFADLMISFTNPIVGILFGAVLNTLLYTVSDIERMADHAMAIAKAALEMDEKKIEFSNQAKGELAVLEQAVLDIVDRTVAAYGTFNLDKAIKIEPQEQVVDALVREVKSRHVRRLRDGLCTVEYGFVLEDLLTACERTADHCSNVAVEMLQVAEGKLEAHEYLNALKAGELYESAAFAEHFARYKAKYAFPEEV